jgi:D-serine deaminase-like pyridoxal phosphate-dependent protein
MKNLNLPLAGNELWRDVVDTPAVLIDLDIVERNIIRGQARLDDLGLKVRPHIKTHKLPLLAHAQLAAGAIGVTAQKLGEAEVMADAGVEDILLSYNIVGERKLRRLRQLADRCRLTVVADSEEIVRGLAAAFEGASKPLAVLVECDTGMRRCGVLTPEAALQLAKSIHGRPGLRFAGLMTYPAPGQGNSACEWLEDAARLVRANGLTVESVSTGGTPDLHALTHNSSITEYRPGSYVYNDRSVLSAGSCAEADCALTVLTTVVSSPEDRRAVVDAGTKVLTSDLFGFRDYGLVVGRPDISIVSLNEEHGRLECGQQAPAVGDVLRVIPNHACVVSNMVDHVHFVRGDFFVHSERVAARGMS